jgi:hypothetical protein
MSKADSDSMSDAFCSQYIDALRRTAVSLARLVRDYFEMERATSKARRRPRGGGQCHMLCVGHMDPGAGEAPTWRLSRTGTTGRALNDSLRKGYA